MLIIPAIDILNGKCVRLYKGDYSKVDVYSSHPVEIAQRFVEAGTRLIHIVDLNAAGGFRNNNRRAIRNIRKHVSCILQVGGGIRSEADIEELIDIGVERIVLSTMIVKNPKLVSQWIIKYGYYALGGVDAVEGKVKITGWTGSTDLEDTALALKLKSMGLREIIYTSIARDGTLSGPDILRTNSLAEIANLPVILSGGISSGEDVEEVFNKRDKNIIGIIMGRALYEKKVSFQELIKKYQTEQDKVKIL